jgi:hypothetical protein
MRPIIAVALITTCLGSLGGTLMPSLRAQESFGTFSWQKGQVFRYRVDHKTTAKDMQGANSTEVQTELGLLKEWKVLEVDEVGSAQIQLKLLALRSVTKRPDGQMFSFDSTKPEESTPQLRDQLSKYVRDPVALLVVDKSGKVKEVRENRFGSAKRYDTDPPMGVVLGSGPIILGSKWERDVTISSDPTAPASETNGWKALVNAECIAATASSRTIKVDAKWVKEPESSEARISLLQHFPATEVVLDQPGMPPKLIVSKMDRTIKHGEKDGSLYRLISDYRESRIDE